MARFTIFALVALFHSAAGNVLKIGAITQSSGIGANGRKALEVWKAWLDTASATTGFTVTLNVRDYNTSTLTSDVAALAADSHVLIPPYGSTGSIAFIEAVPSNFTGPIVVWGGASDTIYTTCNATGQKCFGMFTKGSQYVVPALRAVLSKSSSEMQVSLVKNENGFSASVCSGAQTFIENTDGYTLEGMHTVSKGALSQADKDVVTNMLTQKPDVVVICGHSGGDVETVVKMISDKCLAAAADCPKAVIATNSITASARAVYTNESRPEMANGLLMPTQWSQPASMKDDVTSWTTQDFFTAMAAVSVEGSYHTAAAGAAGITITKAVIDAISKSALTPAGIATCMAAVNTPSFYGRISFNTDGSIQKQMYFQQMNPDNTPDNPIFSTMYGAMTFPLSSSVGWGTGLTCANWKAYYKSQACCGAPDKRIPSYGYAEITGA